MLEQPQTRPAPGRSLSGRTVLICFVAFFGVVAAANGILIRAATSTFGGVETESSYKAGLAFKSEISAARAQDARGWRVDGTLARNAEGQAVVEIAVRDAAGAAIGGVTATARLSHPADAQRDHRLVVAAVGPGRFRGTTQAESGQWDLVVDLSRGEERLFRSKSRVNLR